VYNQETEKSQGPTKDCRAIIIIIIIIIIDGSGCYATSLYFQPKFKSQFKLRNIKAIAPANF
jgi:hypothetical protein